MLKCYLEYLNNQFNIVDLVIDPALNEIDIQSIHDYRVASKKIRVMLNLIEKNNFIKIFNNNFSFLIKYLGKIREMQIAYILSEEKVKINGIELGVFEEYIHKKINKAHKKLLNHIKTQRINLKEEYNSFNMMLSKSLNSEYNNEQFIKLTNKFIKKKIFKISYLFKNNEKKLHKLRKNLKATRYVYEIFVLYLTGNNYNNEYLNITNKRVELIKSYEAKLGKWHDHIILCKYLKKIFKETHLKYPFSANQINMFYHKISNETKLIMTLLIDQFINDKEMNEFLKSSDFDLLIK